MKNQEIRYRLEEVMSMIPCPMSGCWGLHGAETACYYIELEEYWLSEDDLEPDTGGPLEIEQPNKITTHSLSPKEQDDRIRMVFGLTSNDPLPDVDYGTLETYHKYLFENLVFPFHAEHTSETGPFSSRTIQVKVLGLSDPDDDLKIDDLYGIMCEARHERRLVILPLGELEVKKEKQNQWLVEDYSYWFWNWI